MDRGRPPLPESVATEHYMEAQALLCEKATLERQERALTRRAYHELQLGNAALSGDATDEAA